MNKKLIDLLAEGDKRTVNHVTEAVQWLESSPNLISAAIELLRNESEAIAMRAADCLEKFSRRNSFQLNSYKYDLVDVLVNVKQKEVRWHLAQILPRLKLSSSDLKKISKIWIHDYYNSPSSIVRAESLQALYEIRTSYPIIMSDFKKALTHGIDNGTPAVKARASLIFRDL